jgi:hypothetical protein
MAAEVQAGSEFKVGKAQPLFEVRALNYPFFFETDYEVAPDGQRFLINTPGSESGMSTASILLNWMTGH